MPWEFDSNLSKVEWSVKYLGIATVRGWFRDVKGELDFESEQPTDWKARIVIAAGSAYTNYPQLDEHLLTADFLEAEKYPTIQFVSRKVESLPGDGRSPSPDDRVPGVSDWQPKFEHLRISGDVSLHGITKPVELDAWYLGQATDVRGRTRRAFEATTRVRRDDFNIYMPPQVDPGRVIAGQDVALNITVITTQVQG